MFVWDRLLPCTGPPRPLPESDADEASAGPPPAADEAAPCAQTDLEDPTPAG